MCHCHVYMKVAARTASSHMASTTQRMYTIHTGIWLKKVVNLGINVRLNEMVAHYICVKVFKQVTSKTGRQTVDN